MSFIKALLKWEETTKLEDDRLVLFDRIFTIDEMTGVTRLGLKFSIAFVAKKFFQYGYPEGKIRILEGMDCLNLNGRVHVQIDYCSGEDKGIHRKLT